MSAKLLQSGAEPLIARHHIALESIVFQERKPANRWADVFGTGQKIFGGITAAPWTRLRLPCRRLEWWR